MQKIAQKNICVKKLGAKHIYVKVQRVRNSTSFDSVLLDLMQTKGSIMESQNKIRMILQQWHLMRQPNIVESTDIVDTIECTQTYVISGTRSAPRLY